MGCSICAREDQQEINDMLLQGVPYRDIGDRYGLSLSTLARHKAHLKTQMMQLEPDAVDEPSAILKRLASLDERAEAIYRKSFRKDDTAAALRALRELRSILELAAKLTGELTTVQTVHQHVHVTASPEWLSLRQIMLKALAPYPDARQALIEAIEGMNDAAK